MALLCGWEVDLEGQRLWEGVAEQTQRYPSFPLHFVEPQVTPISGVTNGCAQARNSERVCQPNLCELTHHSKSQTTLGTLCEPSVPQEQESNTAKPLFQQLELFFPQMVVHFANKLNRLCGNTMILI